MQFKLTAFYAFGFFENYEVDDPLKFNLDFLTNFHPEPQIS